MRLTGTVRTAFLAFLCVVGCAATAPAASLDEITPLFSAQHYEWREYAAGQRLLKEDGWLYSGGARVGVLTDSAMTITGKAEMFGGIIDYNGQTQPPNPVPVSTDVDYVGTRGEADLGYRLPPAYFGLEPFAGLGYRWWYRDLQNSTTATGMRVSGYTEYWDTFYCRLGARGRYKPDSGWGMFAEAGAKYPFYTGNSVDFAGFGTTTFHPGANWSAFAESGVTYRHLRISFTYEGFRFSKSPVKMVGSEAFYQPESTADLLGVSVGWNFK